ncbi:MAG: alanine racemase [Patescibacteria group bacterium]
MLVPHATWLEISKSAFEKNLAMYRHLIGDRLLCSVVKANAYGHGLSVCAPFLESLTSWFGVTSVAEAAILRDLGIQKPLYILGPVLTHELPDAVRYDCRIVLSDLETAKRLSEIALKMGKKVSVHMKVETGNHRQGVMPEHVLSFARGIMSEPGLVLEGITTHFSNIEDALDHSYADTQISLFKKIILELESNNIFIPIKHCANTAATLLFPQTYFDMARVGIGLYGLCPSPETLASLSHLNKNFVQFHPVLSWKTKIAQIKNIPKGAFVGYGCTYQTTRPTTLAILPVGYYDGYDRGLSNIASVLIRGKRAPVRGRVCMDMMMVDVTDIPGVHIEDCATLIGHDSNEHISAGDLADLAGTIHWEITTRIRESMPRILVS